MQLKTLVDQNFQLTLRKLLGQTIPLKTAFALKGIAKKADDELNKYNEVRTEALKTHGTKKDDGSLDADEQGNVKFIDESAAKLFIGEITALLETEVDLGTIKLADLGDKMSISAAELMSLDNLIQE